jgi:hypothetical protein
MPAKPRLLHAVPGAGLDGGRAIPSRIFEALGLDGLHPVDEHEYDQQVAQPSRAARLSGVSYEFN